MKRVLNPGPELITAEWLESIADHVASGHAYFEVEGEKGGINDGHVLVKVEMPTGDPREESFCMQLENGWWTSEGLETISFCAGSFKYRDDVLAMLELLARGWHG